MSDEWFGAGGSGRGALRGLRSARLVPRRAGDLAAGDPVALGYAERREVGVEAAVATAVVDHDSPAVSRGQLGGYDDGAGRGRLDRRADRAGDVQAAVAVLPEALGDRPAQWPGQRAARDIQ